MKLLLTSQSISNRSIEKALRDLLPKPSAGCTAVYVITSQNAAVGDKSWLIKNLSDAHKVGWKSFEIIDVAAMINLPKEMWWQRIEAADVLFVGGGANFYLSYWLERSGLAEALPSLVRTKVYVGSSAGSIAVCQSLRTGSQAIRQLAHGEEINLDALGPAGQRSPRTIPLVDIEFRPHYLEEDRSFVNDEVLQRVANICGHTLYAVDDNSAVKVSEGRLEVVSEGRWKSFNPHD